MPRVSASYAAARRAEVLAAAQQCFAERGYRGSTMSDVIGAGGLSAGVVYRAFGSKEELWYAVVNDVLESVGNRVISGLQALPDGDPRAALEMVLTATADQTPTVRRIAVFAWAEAQHDAVLRTLVAGHYRAVEDQIRAKVDTWPLGDLDQASLTRLLLGTLPGSYVVESLLS